MRRSVMCRCICIFIKTTFMSCLSITFFSSEICKHKKTSFELHFAFLCCIVHYIGLFLAIPITVFIKVLTDYFKIHFKKFMQPTYWYQIFITSISITQSYFSEESLISYTLLGIISIHIFLDAFSIKIYGTIKIYVLRDTSRKAHTL